jgi:predicted negative regulator of RcsB-dependent stress response
MTHPSSSESSTGGQYKAEGFMDWFQINSRWISVGAVVVVIALLLGWYVTRASALKNSNADKQLLLAKQSVASGNIPLAESDLKKVADRFAGTTAGAEAGMMLGQLRLEKGDYPGAVTYLQELVPKLSGPNAAAARGLLGDALSQNNKPAEAAAEYEKAVALTTMPNEKISLQMRAGHAYMAAGKVPEAKKIWEALASQDDDPSVAAEAHVRLGELAVAAAKS